MSENLLVAEERTEFGKGAARRVRREHKVPAVLYGHGMAPKHLSLPGHDLMLALKHGGTNALLTLQVDGEEQLALPKAVTRDPIKGFLEHVDLVVVRRGEKVTVDVAIHLVGEHDREVLVTQPVGSIRIEAEATHLPERFEYDVSEIGAGDNVTAEQIQLPPGSTLVSDPQQVVVSGQSAPTAAQLESELAEAEAEVGITPTVDEPAAAPAAEAPAEGEPAEAPAPAE
ncbi:MAG TPA: 50S ribosomal protein L25/general stress protein Ctc [Mycobacteriales bacterium]